MNDDNGEVHPSPSVFTRPQLPVHPALLPPSLGSDQSTPTRSLSSSPLLPFTLPAQHPPSLPSLPPSLSHHPHPILLL